MRIRVLGCSGGIGGRHLRTTSMLLDRVFLTHSHLDHVAAIPFMVDTVGQMRDVPLTVHAIPATIEILKNHVFNWSIWPDFTQIPSAERPFLRYQSIDLGSAIDLGGGRTLTP